MIKGLKKVLSSSWLQHLVFWVLSLYAIGSYFSISNTLKIIDFIYAGIFHLPLVLMVYVNLRYLIPVFFQKGRYFPFILLSIFNVGLAYFLHELLFEEIVPQIATEFYIVSFTDSEVLLTILVIYLVVSTLLKLSKSWYKLQQLENERLSQELNALKMQVNPHFLFNSLNSIYSLARKKSEDTPDVILRLSDLMRYMIYEVPDEKVILKKEIEAIENYLGLQRVRLEKEVKVDFDVDVENPEIFVPPLLFFPLIENSFKHGLKSESGNFVQMAMRQNKNDLEFCIKNNRSKFDDLENGKYGGIGLDNVRKRLELIFGGRAEMQVISESDYFEVKLKIETND